MDAMTGCNIKPHWHTLPLAASCAFARAHPPPGPPAREPRRPPVWWCAVPKAMLSSPVEDLLPRRLLLGLLMSPRLSRRFHQSSSRSCRSRRPPQSIHSLKDFFYRMNKFSIENLNLRKVKKEIYIFIQTERKIWNSENIFLNKK